MAEIAKTAVVDKTAQLGKDVVVGPGCVIGADAVISDGCLLKANVMISEGVMMGSNNRVFANCVLGEEPQIIAVVEPKTELTIGDNNVFRENVTVNRGSPNGNGKTVIGNNNYIMIGSHFGHDSQVEDNTVIGNYCQIAGHCKIESNVWMSAICGAHQYVTIGRYAYVGGISAISSDIPPFVRVAGAYPCSIRGLNSIGLKRAGFSEDSLIAMDKAYRRLYRRRNGTMKQVVEEMLIQDELDENVRYLLESLQRSSQHRLGRFLELARQ